MHVNKILTSLLWIMLPATASWTAAQTAIDDQSVMFQNFDTLVAAPGAALPAGWRVSKNDTQVRTVDSYAAASTTMTASGHVASAGDVAINSAAANGIWNLGDSAANSSDRAVGFLSSGVATRSA